jgi:hypothetical protein
MVSTSALYSIGYLTPICFPLCLREEKFELMAFSRFLLQDAYGVDSQNWPRAHRFIVGDVMLWRIR